LDVDGIEPGVDFVKALDDQVAQCSAFIAVIGPGWADLKSAEGQRRLDQPNDHVRIEIESALKRDIRVIPVLVDRARMPTANELPDSLKPLSRRNAITLSHHRFGPEVDELARVLERACRYLGLASLRRCSQAGNRDTRPGTWLVTGGQASDRELDRWLDETTGQSRKNCSRACRVIESAPGPIRRPSAGAADSSESRSAA
jgi:TIR domain-containing protein